MDEPPAVIYPRSKCAHPEVTREDQWDGNVRFKCLACGVGVEIPLVTLANTRGENDVALIVEQVFGPIWVERVLGYRPTNRPLDKPQQLPAPNANHKRNRASRNDPRWEGFCRCGVVAECQCEKCNHGICNQHERWYNVWEGDGDLACPSCYKKLHWWPSKPDRYTDANKG